MKVLVTGASGYIGASAARAAETAGHAVVRGARSAPAEAGGVWVAYGDIADRPDWHRLLPGFDAVVHCAGPAHVGDIDVAWARRSIVDGTQRLAEAAAATGMRRLVFISSALVCGSSSPPGVAVDESMEHPDTPYARMKQEAERRLAAAGRSTALEWVVLRPPMVYGPGSPGNFSRLVAAVAKGMPLPLGAARAPRSVVGIANLVSAIVLAVEHPGARGRTFLVADAEATSTADLVRRIAAAMGRRARLLAVPPPLLRAGARLLGRGEDAERLLRPMLLDAGAIRDDLGWTPPVTLAEGIRMAVAGRRETATGTAGRGSR